MDNGHITSCKGNPKTVMVDNHCYSIVTTGMGQSRDGYGTGTETRQKHNFYCSHVSGTLTG